MGYFVGVCIQLSAVASMCCYTLYIFPDRTVKIWNLKTCTELLTLDKHFSYVRCVRFCPKNNIIFTASQSLIKVSFIVLFLGWES